MRVLVQNPTGAAPQVIHVRHTLLEPSDRPVSELARAAFVLDTSTRSTRRWPESTRQASNSPPS